MKVYAIENGEYSDYHIVGVFSTRENAEYACQHLRDGGQVVEWELDPHIDDLHAGYVPFLVQMLKDGTVERTEQKERESFTFSNEDIFGVKGIWRRTEAPAYRGDPNVQDCLLLHIWAKDLQHAIKICNEKRAQLIANGDWK